VNFVINIFLLYITSVLSKEKLKTSRCILSSLVAGIYSVISLFESFLFSFLLKAVFSIIIVGIAFKNKNFIVCIKRTLTFTFVTFLVGGITIAFVFSLKNVGMFFLNGVFYFDVPIYLILGSTLVSYFFVNLFLKVSDANKKMKYVNVKIELNGKSVNIISLKDTGNLLKDPCTNQSVIICELDAIKTILDKETYDFMKDKKGVPNLNLRYIPFSSLGCESGVIIGFKPDKVIVENAEKTDVIIGVYNKKLSIKHNYTGLVGE